MAALAPSSGSEPTRSDSIVAAADVSILMVDDRPANLVALEATLAPLGHRLVKAASGEEALRHALHNDFALILLDVQMPGMDGYETAALLRTHPRTSNVPIIFITAIHRDSDHVFKGYEHGGVDYLLKPFDPTILRSKVSVFVGLYLNEKKQQREIALARQREREDVERRNEQRFRRLVDSMPLCVWALRADGTPSYSNRSWQQFSGTLEKPGANGRSTSITPLDRPELVHPDDANRVRVLWKRALAQQEPMELEYRLRRQDGVYRWHVGRLAPEHNESGEVVGWIVTATDIESQKKAEEDHSRLVIKERQAREEAEAANRAKDEFLATLSHELRTPLNAMVGWTRMLRTRTLSPEKSLKALETIERNAKAQADLIEDILDVSRIITGKLRIEIQAADLRTIVDAAIEAVRPAAEAKGIALDRDIGVLPAGFFADSARLQQVIWNLLSNAIKFTPAGGRVEINVAGRDQKEVAIKVRDNGRGVHPDFLPYIFDRFRQHDSTTKRTHAGLGLGLAIVRHLVELHGGTVSVESAGEDQGATFTVMLPVRATPIATYSLEGAPRDITPTMVLQEEVVSLAGITVLLVDDEPDARELLCEVLEHYGASAEAAGSADEAIRRLTSRPFDVLLSDIGLPGEDGYALIARVRELPSNKGGRIPAAALTAYARSEDSRRALAAGFLRHAVKPIQPAALAALVKELAGAIVPQSPDREAAAFPPS
jgi:PAS domain S-box-containing protein